MGQDGTCHVALGEAVPEVVDLWLLGLWCRQQHPRPTVSSSVSACWCQHAACCVQTFERLHTGVALAGDAVFGDTSEHGTVELPGTVRVATNRRIERTFGFLQRPPEARMPCAGQRRQFVGALRHDVVAGFAVCTVDLGEGFGDSTLHFHAGGPAIGDQLRVPHLCLLHPSSGTGRCFGT